MRVAQLYSETDIYYSGYRSKLLTIKTDNKPHLIRSMYFFTFTYLALVSDTYLIVSKAMLTFLLAWCPV